MNDKAARLLGALDRSADAQLPGIVPDGLREWLMQGIARRGEALTWGGPTWDAEGAPASFPDLTGWECQASSFHIEDLTPAEVAVTEGQPWISEDGQRVVPLHGIAFAREFACLVYDLDPPVPVRCIVGVNQTSGTFRFHMVRAAVPPPAAI
jgi:hypothetical protein